MSNTHTSDFWHKLAHRADEPPAARFERVLAGNFEGMIGVP
jgi:hypothetical protein